MPINVQLAVQGGGAKICLLLAVFEALQNLEKPENGAVVRVTRIAGTSAGAITACLFAAGIRMQDVRTRLKETHGKELVEVFRVPSAKGWFFPKLRAKKQWFDMLIALAGGKPLWDPGLLETKLRDVFEGARVTRLKELGIPVRVVATDLGNSKTKTYKDEDMIVDALMASAGLPYCFRTWDGNGAPHHVDGGLCENLPVDELKDGENNDPIIAISFKEKAPGSPRNFVQFSKALFDTAINNSMSRARRQLDSSAIFEIEIENPIGTFDFEEALKEGLGKAYGYVREKAEKFFREFADKQHGDAATRYDPWAEAHPAIQRVLHDVGRIYEAQHQPSPFHYLHISVEITAHCLAAELGAKDAKPDIIKLWYRFKAGKDPIYCIKFRIHEPVDSARPYLGVTRWHLRDAQGNELPVPMALPMLDSPVTEPKMRQGVAEQPDPKIARDVVLFFERPLEPGSGPYELFCQDEAFEIMGPLARMREDEFTFSPLRVEGAVGAVELILHAPEQAVLRFIPHPNGTTPGRQMERNELSKWRENSPLGFSSYGWCGADVLPPEFGFKVFR